MHSHQQHHHRRLFTPEGVGAKLLQTAAALPTLIARADDDSDGGDKEEQCAHSTSGICERPTDTAKSTIIPVVLGVCIPVGAAVIVLLLLHRRHVKKLRQEDASDKYKSYDFGLDDVVVSDGKRGGPAMAQREKHADHQHGVSLDLNISTHLPPPSVLGPPGTLSTLSLTPSDLSRPGTARSHSMRDPFDDAYAESYQSGLPPARSVPSTQSDGMQQPPQAYRPGATRGDAPNPLGRTNSGRPLTPSMHSQQVPEIRVSEGQSMSEDIDLPRDLRVQATSPKAVDESAQYITSPPHTMTEHDLHMAESPKVVTLDQELGTTHLDDSIADPTVNKRASFITPPDGYQLDQRRLSSNGIRPLPPMDPNETPAQRASRIRSFYKEYFDPNNAKTKSQYYGDLEDAPVDSVYGAENVPPMPQDAPYAQPMPRRAMTPPPRMPSEAFAPPQALRNGWDSRPSSRGSNIKSPSIRVQSSVSNRFGPTPPPPRREKKRPPPEPLQMIPTPHAIRDDTLITINPIDFAPAQLTKAQREGRPMTPQSGARVPYLPQLPAHIPLVSAYDDLAVMPSPHNLRKSGTYTALDFAPPPKFHNDLSRPGSPLVPPSGFSDSGSLRSPSAAGSRAGAMSPAAAMTIRNGGNRVSRLPQDVVGTVDSMNAELKPKWDMR